MKDKLKFLLLILLTIGYAISFGNRRANYFDVLFYSLYYYPSLIVLLFIMFSSSLDIINSTSSNYIYLSFLDSYKDYHKKIVNESIKNNLMIITLYLVLICSITLFIVGYFTIDINTITYLLYYVFKFIILLNVLSIIFINIYLKFGFKGSIIYASILVLETFIDIAYIDTSISSILNYPILYIDYLMPMDYASIIYDILAFILYISIHMVFAKVVEYLLIKKRKDICNAR